MDRRLMKWMGPSILVGLLAILAVDVCCAILVGLLILAFSILVPIAKQMATEIVVLGRRGFSRSRVLRFIAFRTGKWSMADVLVVAIFMAYVGFKAILDNELKGLNVSGPSLSSITTNHTTLQPAYLVFVSFVLFNLTLSELLKRASAAQ